MTHEWNEELSDLIAAIEHQAADMRYHLRIPTDVPIAVAMPDAEYDRIPAVARDDLLYGRRIYIYPASERLR